MGNKDVKNRWYNLEMVVVGKLLTADLGEIKTQLSKNVVLDAIDEHNRNNLLTQLVILEKYDIADYLLSLTNCNGQKYFDIKALSNFNFKYDSVNGEKIRGYLRSRSDSNADAKAMLGLKCN